MQEKGRKWYSETKECGFDFGRPKRYSTNGNTNHDKRNGCLYSVAFIKSNTKWQLLRFNGYIQTLTTFLPLQTWLLYFICLETPDGFVTWNNYYPILSNTVWENQVLHELFFYLLGIWDIFIYIDDCVEMHMWMHVELYLEVNLLHLHP